MKKYFATKGLTGFVVVYEELDKRNGGIVYVPVWEEFETEKEAEAYAEKLNNKKFKATCCHKEIDMQEVILNHGMCNECMDKASE